MNYRLMNYRSGKVMDETIITMKTVKKERINIDWKAVAQNIAIDKKVVNQHIEQGGKIQQLRQIQFRKPFI